MKCNEDISWSETGSWWPIYSWDASNNLLKSLKLSNVRSSKLWLGTRQEEYCSILWPPTYCDISKLVSFKMIHEPRVDNTHWKLKQNIVLVFFKATFISGFLFLVENILQIISIYSTISFFHSIHLLLLSFE